VALETYREALAIQDRLQDTAGASTTLISTGNILYLQGDYDGAIADYRRSRELSKKFMNTGGEARALEGLGRVFTAQGNYAAALDAFRGVLAEGRAWNNRRAQGSALQHIAEIHFRLGNLDTARASFEESRGHYEAAGDQPNVGRAWQGLALTDLVAGRATAAEQEFAKSITACAGADDRECVAHALVGLAFAQDSQQKFAEAVASYGKAIAAFTALGKREEAARSEVGSSHALFRKGELDLAHAAAAHAREEAVALSSDDVLWRALVADARVLRQKKDRRAALAAVEAAVAAAERLQHLAEQQPGHSPVPDAVEAFAALVVLQTEGGDAEAAVVSAERMRIFALRATLLPNERDIYRGMTAEERAEERAAVAQLIALDAQIARLRSLPRPDTARIEKLKAELADASAKRTNARQRLFDRLPDLRMWRGLAPPPGAADLGNLLSRMPGTVLVQFVMDEDDFVVLSAEAGPEGVALGAWAVPITRQWMAERIARLTQPSILQDEAEWKRSALGITSVLPDEFLERLARARSIVVVPDGAFWRVPFEALPVKEGFLGDARSVSYAGSIAALVAVGSAPPRSGPALVAVAAPDVAPEVRDLALLTAPGWTLRASARAEQEAQRAAAVYTGEDVPASATVVSGKDATEPHVRTAITASGSVLHIAAPFRINAASPLFSPALLASNPPPQDDAADDGMLEAREIMNLTVPARTVVFSDGGAAVMRDAQAATGAIEWAWLAAGAPSIVLNRWVSDETAPDLLAEFHRRLLLGDSSADALRAARAKVRARANRSAPFYWAGWMAVGK
jgi:CHAT domain-containing protein